MSDGNSPLVRHLGDARAWLNGNALKQPSDARGNRLAGWNTDAALMTFTQAASRVRGAVRFVGIRSDAAPDIAALDLDDVLNDGGGVIDAVAWWAHTIFPTYCETTPSGRGLRLYWIVTGQAAPVTIKTADIEVLAKVFDDATGEVRLHTFVVGRELYYRAPRFLIHTGRGYAWDTNGQPDPLATITPADLALIADAIRAGRAGRVQQTQCVAESAAIEPALAPIPTQTTRRDQSQRGIGGLLANFAMQREGNHNRNSCLYWTARRLHEYGLPHSDTDALLTPIALAIGLGDSETHRTIVSAYRGGV